MTAEKSVNPGIDPATTYTNLPPSPGPISPSNFQRSLLTDGHQRQSPGDQLPDGTPAATSGNKSRNVGQADPMEQMPRDFAPISAADFRREHPGLTDGHSAPSPGDMVREAMSPSDYWAGVRSLHGLEPSIDRPALPYNSRGGQEDNR